MLVCVAVYVEWAVRDAAENIYTLNVLGGYRHFPIMHHFSIAQSQKEPSW